MRANEDIYKRIYTKTLVRKNELSKINNLRTNVFPSSVIETDSYLDFGKSKKNLLPSNSAVVYLYEDVLNDKALLDRKSIVPHTVYKLTDFGVRTKVGMIISDETGLIDPDLVSVYVTDMNTLVFMINKDTSVYISIIYLKGVLMYARYNNNVDVPIPASYKNSFVVWTKLDNSPSGAVEWIDPVLNNGQYYIPIRAQGKFSLLMLSDTFKFYNIIPQTNSQYSYIKFPDEIGYTDLNNVFMWRNRSIGFSQPIGHTPLYDGFKVEGVTRTSLTLNGTTGYVSFGSYPSRSELTIHIKFKINAFGDLARVIQRGNSDGFGWCLRTTTDNRIAFQFKKYDILKNITSNPLTANTWYSMTITAATGEVPTMYVNSIQQPSNFIDNSASDSGTDFLVLGRRANASQDYTSIDIDFVRIYNRKLKFSEVLDGYNSIYPSTGMVNEWLFDENTGATLNDTKGSNPGTISGGTTWVNGPDNTVGRLVGFSKRIEYTSKYADLRHQYNKFNDYMTQYLANTLPVFIKNYTPYVPNITLDTLTSDFQDRMVLASKDYPNIVKEYLEETESIKFTDYVTTDINPIYTRANTATSVDGTYSVIATDTPRYVKDSNPMKKGIIIEDIVNNKMPDPLFNTPVALIAAGISNPTVWTVNYTATVQTTVVVANNVLRHTGFNNNSNSIRLTSPSFTVDKTKPLTIQFKVKYIKNTGTNQLYGFGTVTNGVEVLLDSFLFTSYVDADGFTYKEYRIPANTFTGSGTSINIGFWGGWNTYEEKDYYLKEVQVTELGYGGLTFTAVNKAADFLRVPSPNVLNPTVGTLEIWYTPKVVTDRALLQTNDSNVATKFAVRIQADGSVMFSNAGNDTAAKRIVSAAGLITARNVHYIVMAWENKTLYAYINGVLIGSLVTVSDAIIKDLLHIGADVSANYVNGIIHDFRASNTRRSLAEIQAAYTAKTALAVDANTTMKLNFDETIKPPNTVIHSLKLVTNHDLRKRLLFINGLNISPASATYNVPTRKWTSSFRANDVKGSKITEVDTGMTKTPYYDSKIISQQATVFGPSTKITSELLFDVFELDTPADSLGTITIMDPSKYTYTIAENIIKFNFNSDRIGKSIYVCEKRYNQFIFEGYSNDGLLQKLPTWISFLPKEKMLIFLNGRLLEKERYYLFDPFRYQVLKGDTVLVTDLDTNTIDGEIFNGYFTSRLELAEYNVTLTDGAQIVALNDKSFPFSKKYNLVFVDGKLIHPDDIKEIDNYRFSVKTTSTNNMCVFRRRMDLAGREKFSGVKDKWTEYLETLTTPQIATLLGTLNTVVTGENNSRSVFLAERHLFEVLYYYCLKGRDHLTDNDNIRIPIELPGTMLSDGRIPISTMRAGLYPRYQL
jgi:hypothetical protein